MKKTCPGSLRASSPPFGGYCEKQTRETHARGDAKAGGGRGASLRSSVLARLASLVQIGELARSLLSLVEGSLANPSSPGASQLFPHFLTKSGEQLT